MQTSDPQLCYSPYSLRENELSTTPERAMPQQTRKMQNMVKDVEKAAHVPPTAIIRLEISSKMRRPNLQQIMGI